MSVKFRNSKTGEVFEDLGAARFAFCNQKCRECPISCFKNDDGTRCDAYCVHHAWKAAKLMGYEVVEDSNEVEINHGKKDNQSLKADAGKPRPSLVPPCTGARRGCNPGIRLREVRRSGELAQGRAAAILGCASETYTCGVGGLDGSRR